LARELILFELRPKTLNTPAPTVPSPQMPIFTDRT
jgi:hypothetical protein